MANTLLTISMITREALAILENNLKLTGRLSRKYDSKYGIEGAKIGTTLNIRKPSRYVGTTGQALSVEDSTESQVALTLTTQFHVDIQFSSVDLALSIDDFSKRFLRPAIATIANKIDFDSAALYKKVYNNVGTPATVPTQLVTYLQGGQKLDEEACPMDGQRTIVMTPAMQVQIVNALTGLFQSATAIAKQYMTGHMGTAIGAEWVMDQNIRTHTYGVRGGTPLVNGASQTGSSLVTDGWTAAIATRVLEGDTFTMTSVNAVNPQNRQNTGDTRDFVVTADTASDGSGNMTIPISPAITPGSTNQFRTVTASPADDAALTFTGAASADSPQGLYFHPDFATMAMADLPLPDGVDRAARVSDDQLGVSMRMIRAYDINTDNWPCRIDVLYGHQALYPELACRIQS